MKAFCWPADCRREHEFADFRIDLEHDPRTLRRLYRALRTVPMNPLQARSAVIHLAALLEADDMAAQGES